LSPFFGFAQFDFAGTLPLADGRYLARHDDEESDSVLVVQTLVAPPRPSRRRHKPRDAEAAPTPPEVPVARATAIRAFEPFEGPEEAAAWLAGATASEEAIEAVVATGIALLNAALHAQAVAIADPHPAAVTAERAVAVRLGYGSGKQTAESTHSEAREVDVRIPGRSPRRRRQEEVRPQERVAALLRGRERADACETLLLRARADLDAGRRREAALQLRVGIDAVLFELRDALDDADHARDIDALEARRPAVEAAAERALRGDLAPEAENSVSGALELAERILRRRRLLTE
jgi:hypothetical protein